MVGDEQAVALRSGAAAAMSRHATGARLASPGVGRCARHLATAYRFATQRSRVDPPIPIQRRCRYDRDGTCHW